MHSLRLQNLLDTAAEGAFDHLAELAAAICGTPISLVSLVDQDRQWFKARYGLAAFETPREHAFCSHAIADASIMVVEDATEDERFAENPLVTGDPHIRFYAGAPLEISPGIRLGTLCVIDSKPRTLNDHQLKALGILRNAVVNLIELRRARIELTALSHALPICAWCRSVRVENQGQKDWQPLHEYIAQTIPVTHGICPPCVKSAN